MVIWLQIHKLSNPEQPVGHTITYSERESNPRHPEQQPIAQPQHQPQFVLFYNNLIVYNLILLFYYKNKTVKNKTR